MVKPSPLDKDSTAKIAWARYRRLMRFMLTITTLIVGMAFVVLYRENGMVRLDPANAMYDPHYYEPHEVEVQGKLAGLLRRYH